MLGYNLIGVLLGFAARIDSVWMVLIVDDHIGTGQESRVISLASKRSEDDGSSWS